MSRYTLSFLASTGFALLLGFGLLPHDLITAWFHASGFYFIATAVALWTLSLRPAFSKNLWTQFKPHLPAVILSALFIFCILSISQPQLRILYDEANLLGVSQAMYEHQNFYIPIQGIFQNDHLSILDSEWGIRPLLFPFLLFVVHLIKGYGPANVFWLNAIAGLLALYCFYLLLQRFFAKSLSCIGMAILALYPIFALWTTSGGFEIVNLCLAILAFYQLDRLLSNGTSQDATRLIFTLVLLAQVRYESAIFLIAIVPIVIKHCISNPDSKPQIIAAIAPILLLPVAWQRQLYSGDQAFMVAQDQPMFAFTHFLTNIQHAFDFFGGLQSTYGTIPFLLYPAIIGLVWAIVHLIRKRHSLPARTWGITTAALASLALLSTLIFGYILGNLTRPFSIRLGIIFLPFIITPIIYLFHIGVTKIPKLIYAIALIPVVILFYSVPVISRNEAVEQLTLFQINRAYHTFLQDHKPSAETLVISQHARLFIPLHQSAITFDYANQNWPQIGEYIDTDLVQNILVFQLIDPNTRQIDPQTQFSIHQSLKPLVETNVGNRILRASQIVLNP